MNGPINMVGKHKLSAAKTSLQFVSGIGGALLFVAVGLASPPSHNTLRATFHVVSFGPSSIVEVKLRPTEAWDTVRVEAASGVGALTPPCSFSAVVAGGSYVCRVSVSPKAGEASFTLSVVGQRAVDPAKPRLVEVSHFTLPNRAFVAPGVTKSPKPTPGLISTPGATTQ
jgi:hypothetical protein